MSLSAVLTGQDVGESPCSPTLDSDDLAVAHRILVEAKYLQRRPCSPRHPGEADHGKRLAVPPGPSMLVISVDPCAVAGLGRA